MGFPSREIANGRGVKGLELLPRFRRGKHKIFAGIGTKNFDAPVIISGGL